MKNQFLYEPKPKKQKKQKKNKFLLGMISLAVITLASCSNWGFPDPDGLRIPNWGKSTTVAVSSSQFTGTAMDAEGNIIAVGYQQTNSVYGYGDGVTVSGVANHPFSNAVIVKYEADTGKTLWAKSTVKASSSSQFTAVATDRFGNIYAVGTQYNNGIFGYGNGVTVSGACSGHSNSNAVLVKYNKHGQALWARSVNPAPSGSEFKGVAVDQDGNIVAVGIQNGNGLFSWGNGVTASGGSTASTNPSSVIVKYTPTGNAIWAKSMPSVSGFASAEFTAVATDKFGNIYVAGQQYQDSSVTNYNYGNGVVVKTVTSDTNSVLLKYNKNGKTIWGRTAVSAQAEWFYQAVAVDKKGYIYVTGNAPGKMNYGNGVSINIGTDFGGTLIKYDKDGYPIWVTAGKPPSNKFSDFKAITTTFAGDIYAVGLQSENGNYNYGNGVTVKGTGNSYNAVVVAYNTDGKTLWAKTTTKGNDESQFYGITAGNNKLFVVGYQNKDGEFNYGNDAGDIKGAYDSGGNAVITTFEH